MTRVAIIDVPAPCAWINTNERLHRMAKANLTKQWRRAGFVAARGTVMTRKTSPPNGPKTPGFMRISDRMGTAPEVLATPPEA